MSSKKSCGPHVELSSTPHARITRCPCGTVHLHLSNQGLTLRIDDDALRGVGDAFGAALRLLDGARDEAVATPDGVVN
jgi:hypothetical protein